MPTNVDGPSGANTINPADSWMSDGLTPESLLVYCQTRLGSLDDLIKERFDDQQRRAGDMKLAGEVLALVSTWPEVTERGAGAEGAHAEMGNKLMEAYNKAGNPELKERIAAVFAKVVGRPMTINGGKAEGAVTPANLNPDGIKKMDPTSWQTFVSAQLKTVQDSLSKDGELSMIQLQSMVSQRQLCIQLTTQVMQTLHETKKTVVGNIR